MKRKILSDVYQISKRIRDIDPHYYIVYDTKKAKFEVHNSAQINNTYCLTLPYEVLDVRTLDYVNKTRAENADRIIKEIENENNLKNNEEIRAIQRDMNELVETELKRR